MLGGVGCSLAFLLLGACETQEGKGAEIVVFAASSLQKPLEELEQKFERQNPALPVRLTFAGSQVLRLQIEQGAAADIFASADQIHMSELVKAGLMTEARLLTESELVVITPQDDHRVRSFEDLPKARRLVLGREEVPVGQYARDVLVRAAGVYGLEFSAQVQRNVVSKEGNVRLVQAKVELGEADAAFVYRTEALRSERVRIVEIPPHLNVRAKYEIGLRNGSSKLAAARKFVQYVLSGEGKAVFSGAGFRTGVADAP